MDPVYPWTWWRMATTRPRVLKLIMRREASTWIEQNYTECNNHLCWIQFIDVPCCTGENQFHTFSYLSLSSQMNTMTTISNDFPSSRSTDNLNYQKVLLTAAAAPTSAETTTATTVTQQQQHNINITTDTAHQLDTGTDKSSSNKMFNKMLLMSPILGPVVTTRSVFAMEISMLHHLLCSELSTLWHLPYSIK